MKVSFTYGEYHEEVGRDVLPMDCCHLFLGANWFNKHKIPKEGKWYKYVTPTSPNPHQGALGTYPNSHRFERQKMERNKGVQCGNSIVEKGEDVWSGSERVATKPI